MHFARGSVEPSGTSNSPHHVVHRRLREVGDRGQPRAGGFASPDRARRRARAGRGRSARRSASLRLFVSAHTDLPSNGSQSSSSTTAAKRFAGRASLDRNPGAPWVPSSDQPSPCNRDTRPIQKTSDATVLSCLSAKPVPRQYTPRRAASSSGSPPRSQRTALLSGASLLLDWPSGPSDGQHLRCRKARPCLGGDRVGGRQRQRLCEPGAEVARRRGDRAARLPSELRRPEPGPAAHADYRDGRAQHRQPVLAGSRPRRRGRGARARLRAPAREQRRRPGEGGAGPPPVPRQAGRRHPAHESVRQAPGGPARAAQGVAACRSCS